LVYAGTFLLFFSYIFIFIYIETKSDLPKEKRRRWTTVLASLSLLDSLALLDSKGAEAELPVLYPLHSHQKLSPSPPILILIAGFPSTDPNPHLKHVPIPIPTPTKLRTRTKRIAIPNLKTKIISLNCCPPPKSLKR